MAEALESALRIRIWNGCRRLGMSQDVAIQFVATEIDRIKRKAQSSSENQST